MPERIQLRRTKGWRMPANTVRVCRPGKWGNPYKVGSLHGAVHSPAFAVEMYRDWLLHGAAQANLREALPTLRGRNLACWCRLGEPCHADVLLEMANA